MPHTPDPVPDDVNALKVALAEARAKLSGAVALIAHLQLQIAKLRREHLVRALNAASDCSTRWSCSSRNWSRRVGDDEARAETSGVEVKGFTRRQAARRNFPAHLPRGAWFTRRRRHALAAAAQDSRRLARTSPRRSMWCRGSGS
jgi:transposase